MSRFTDSYRWSDIKACSVTALVSSTVKSAVNWMHVASSSMDRNQDHTPQLWRQTRAKPAARSYWTQHKRHTNQTRRTISCFSSEVVNKTHENFACETIKYISSTLTLATHMKWRHSMDTSFQFPIQITHTGILFTPHRRGYYRYCT